MPTAGSRPSLLLDLKGYLEARGAVSLFDLVNHYRIEPDALRGMLAHWCGKGRLRRHDFAGECGACPQSKSCGSCTSSTCFEIYEWRGRAGDGEAASADRRS